MRFFVKIKIDDKQRVLSKLSGGKDRFHSKHSAIDTSHVKRSPLTVVLFGLGNH